MKSYRFKVSSALVTMVLAQGCSASSAPDSPASDGDVASYRQLASSVQLEASSYQSAMQGPDVTQATCQSLHDRYDQSVRPRVWQMLHSYGSMDALMGSHDGSALADYGCVTATMLDELDLHRSVACSSLDPATNRLEADRHADAMARYTSHVQERCDQALGALDHGEASWGPRMQGCQVVDGHCGTMMPDECCDGSMPGHCQTSE